MSSHSVSLLQKAERSYRVLWTHKLFDISNNLGLRNWRIRYRWRYEHRNSRIIVTGTKSIGGSYDLQTGYGSAKRIVGLPTEAYCYAARLEKFVRC